MKMYKNEKNIRCSEDDFIFANTECLSFYEFKNNSYTNTFKNWIFSHLKTKTLAFNVVKK